jgi:hypothetical protein
MTVAKTIQRDITHASDSKGIAMTQASKVTVYTPGGKVVGYFQNPQVDMDPDHEYQISGEFVEEDGTRHERIEFNPQVLPYTIDISAFKKCNHSTLVRGYIQRGRQPVTMTATCKPDNQR